MQPPEAPEFPSTTKPPTTPLRGTAVKAARVLRNMNNEDEPPSADQLDQYSRLKDDMLQATRKHGSMHFVGREANNHVGLINQGATCYLSAWEY